MTNRQVNGAQNYTPQASFIMAPQQQPMLLPNLNQQPLIAAINPQIPQLQPVYIIAGGSSMPVMNPMMYQYNSMVPLTNAPMQFMYYPQTFRPNPISSRQLPANSLPPKPLEKIIDKKETQKPPVPQRQKSKEVTMLYRYQKPVTVNDLKHPSDKYKDLIYRPKFLTSKNIHPPTEELVPKLDVGTMTPLVDIKSRLNLTPSTGRGPFLVGDLKLPVEKVESAKKSVNKLPTLVEDLRLPIEKTPEPEIKKPEVKSELIQVPDPDLFKFIESSKNSLSYIGKFHYPPEVDFNDVAEIQDAFYQENIEKLGDNRPKSVLVKVSFEKDSFELAKILFNPNVIVEFNQFIEAKKLDKESTDRPKSSKLKEKEERSPRLSKALKNVQEINESFKMEQSTLNENLRVPSRQSVKVVEHDDRNQVHKRALSNAIEVNEIIQDHEVKIESHLKMEDTEKLSVKNQKPNSAAKKRVLSNALQLNEKVDSHQVENDISLKREKSQIIEISNHNESKRPKSRAFSNAFQILETVENKEAKEEPNLTRDKSQIIKPSAENDFDLKERATFIPNEMNEHQLAEFAEQSDEIARQKSIVADERIHSANPNKNLTEKAFYESNQVMENVTSEDLLDQDSNRPKSEKVEVQLQNENFQDQSQEKFVTDIPIRNDIEGDDAADEVNIEQFESNIKNHADTKHHEHHEHHFHFHGGNRICCSAHRRHDPYYHIESKVKSFENFSHHPHHNNYQIFSEKLNWNKESKIKALSELDLSQLNTHRSSQLLVFHELPKWNELVDSKVKSFENFRYKPSESSLRIYNEKIRWNSESRLKSYLNSTHGLGSQTKLDSNREALMSELNRPDWFPAGKHETFNVYYKKWPSEPRVKETTFRPAINENWNVESRIKAISWENIKYKPKTNRRKRENFKSIPEKKNPNLNRPVKNPTKQKDVSQIWNQEYNRIKQENKQKRNSNLKNLKTPRKNKMETPETTKLSGRQSMSKYKELPPIKSGKENNFYKPSNLDHTAFQRDETPEDKPSWNLISSSQRSFSRMFNQELNDQSQKRFKYDADLKKKANDLPDNASRMSQYEEIQSQNQSQFGTELINDLRLPRIKSSNRKSTPDTFRMSSIQAPSVMNTTFDKDSVIQERKITKRTKKPKETKNGKESRLSKQFEPQVDGFKLQGSTLTIEGDAKVRPLANMNYKNAEEKVKIRATSRLYSSLMTPRSYFSNDTSMNF